MDIATCYPCSKYFLAIINLFFWLTGLLFIFLGIYFLVQPEVQQFLDLLNFGSSFFTPFEIAIAFLVLIGFIIFFIGFLGYCGAQRDSQTFLILYIFFVSSVLVIELVFFLFIAQFYHQGEEILKTHLIDQMKTYDRFHPASFEFAIDSIQTRYQCCGIDSAFDFQTMNIPSSCCSIMSDSICTIEQVGLSGVPGCFSQLKESSLFWTNFILIFELIICFIAFIGIFVAICVCQHSMIYDDYTQTFYDV